MSLSVSTLKMADRFLFILFLQAFLLIVTGLYRPILGDTLSIKEELAFLAEEGQVVESASKYPQLVREAPGSVTVITRDEIKRYGWRTLADLLRTIPGFYVTDDKNYNYLGVNGISRPGNYNSRILALLNGHTLNEDVYQQFFMGRDSGIDLDIVGRVEIVKGPGSALYGTDAQVAVINIITKEGKEINGLRSSVEAGSGNTNKGILTYGKTFSNGWDILIDASYLKSVGQYIHFAEYDPADPGYYGGPTNHNGITNNDGEYAYNLYYRAKYQDLTIQLAGNDREKQLPTAYYVAVFNDPREETYDGHYLAELKYDHAFSAEYGLMVRVYDDWYRYRGYYPELGYPTSVLNTDYSVGQNFGGELQFRRDFGQWNKLIVGTEYQRHHVLLQNYDTDSGPGLACFDRSGVNGTACLDTSIRFDLFSLYIEDEIKPFDDLTLTLGVRRDQYINYSDVFSEKTTPRFGLVYTPLEGTTLKFLYGQAFRAPSSFELYYCNGSVIACGAHPKPETLSMYEGVWEQKLGQHFTSSLSAFTMVAEDMIDGVPDTVTRALLYQNFSRVRTEGAEAGIKGRWQDGLEGYANISFQWKAQYDLTQTQLAQIGLSRSELSNSPQTLAQGGLIFPLVVDRAFVSFEEQYVGSRFIVVNGTGREMNFNPYLLSNLTLTIPNLIQKLEFQASIFNLLDHERFDPVMVDPTDSSFLRVPQKGRTFYMKTSYIF